MTILAWSGDEVVGCAAVVRDPLSWSGHVAELRVVLRRACAARAWDTQLTEEAFATALRAGAEKITARMTIDQKGAHRRVRGPGFLHRGGAARSGQDRDGRKHDMLILSHDVARIAERHAAYGLDEAF